MCVLVRPNTDVTFANGRPTYSHDQRAENDPAEIEVDRWFGAGHLFNTIAETSSSEYPVDGNGLEEDQEQHGHPAGRVIIHQIEQVHSTLATLN
jgi:hypothetical protein